MQLAHPVRPPAPSIVVAEQAELTTPLGHILLVDDDDTLRNLLTQSLRRAAYRISCASDGQAGWNALCAGSFDMVITDYEMPCLTGLDLLRRIRQGQRQVPVILMSGNLPWEEEDLRQLLVPGVAMGKPFFFVEMLENIRRLLDIGRGAARERRAAEKNSPGGQPVGA